ncbi:hypothetical protein [Polynucleobacter sp. JS-Polo-80-F4]|uniref:hypothetical protein n=1 Tax=Polynucleobacter sp. JS-Polo-80-F4 TaxID=2576918 RepID=UPI001C0C6010|nr:hypothetical protein [Polynucleobacter sp. JS-Polo-80-F4]MBU3616561.1 hypothetical protein [Polynucleobacter sp. JS-Polo-80-F4]
MFKLFKISSEWFIGLVISSMVYTFLFYFNNWLTSSITFGLGVSWIYLPAGLRLFLTLIFGLPGAIGIAVASFLISYYGDFPHDLTLCIGVGLISGFAPYLARYFVFSNIRLESDLSNLSFPKLIACILIYSLLSAGLHQWWFSIMTLEDTGSLNHFVVMFIGDVLGSLLLISLIKSCLDLLRKTRKIAH